MAWDKKSYDAKYIKENIFCKRLPFNRNNPEDAELLSFINKQPNFTAYVKDLIRKDMERQREQPDQPPPTGTIPCILVDGGFEDKEAIREAEEKNHRIRTERYTDRWEITVDLDARKVIREIDHRPEMI